MRKPGTKQLTKTIEVAIHRGMMTEDDLFAKEITENKRQYHDEKQNYIT